MELASQGRTGGPRTSGNSLVSIGSNRSAVDSETYLTREASLRIPPPHSRQYSFEAADQSLIFCFRPNCDSQVHRSEPIEVSAGTKHNLLLGNHLFPEQMHVHICIEPEQQKICARRIGEDIQASQFLLQPRPSQMIFSTSPFRICVVL